MSNRDLELAGFTDVNGDLGKPVPSGHVLVPGKVELAGDSIHWELTGPARWQEISQATLTEFLMLRSGEPSRILKFARRWGVLAMRQMGKESVSYCPCGESMSEGSDQISAWQYYARRVYALLNIASSLRQDKLGDLGDWRVIAAIDDKAGFSSAALDQHIYGLGCCMFPEASGNQSAVEVGRQIVAREVTNWLSCWRGHRRRGVSDFSVQWNSKARRWQLQMDYHGYLFAGIGLQLALCIAGADSLYTCSGCGCPYVREFKRPKRGTSNYCPKCNQKGVAQRRAVDTYREKKAEVIRLQAAGIAPDEIARRLNAPVSQITKWLSKKQPKAKTHRKKDR
jgi:hypothetical protein